METVERSVVARGWQIGKENRQSTDFWSSEKTLYETIMMDTYHYKMCSQTVQHQESTLM